MLSYIVLDWITNFCIGLFYLHGFIFVCGVFATQVSYEIETMFESMKWFLLKFVIPECYNMWTVNTTTKVLDV